MANCSICKKELNTGSVDSEDCGGDCRECVADAGDPDAIRTMNSVSDEEKYLHLLLADLRKSYEAQAQPIIDRLFRINSVKIPVYVIDIPELMNIQRSISEMMENHKCLNQSDKSDKAEFGSATK